MKHRIPESEMILNPDGSIFHLHLKPGELAEKIILVGDPGRVETIVAQFETIETTAENREFKSVTGYYNNKRISVISTGIGTDNIDIVMNELDALVNIDFETRTVKDKLTSLTIVRIGTSGSIQESIPVDSWLLSEKSIGFDGLLNFYAQRDQMCDLDFENEFVKFTNWSNRLTAPYVVDSSNELVLQFTDERVVKGVTISAPGFYGPQGREVRAKLAFPELNDTLSKFEHNGYRITNFEMESSAIAGLAKILNHKAITICAIIANRVTKAYSNDYKPVISELIGFVLKRI